MTIAELEVLLQTQNGLITEVQALDFRNSYFVADITEAYQSDLWALKPDIEFVGIEPIFWYTLKKAVIDWLLTDDYTEEEEAEAEANQIDLEYDVVSHQDGDKVERNLRQDGDIPQALKDELLIEIGQRAFRIDSSKLVDAINNVTP